MSDNDSPKPGADSLLSSSPGVLQGEVNLMLNTRHAQQLFAGRPAKSKDGKQSHPGIIGVRRFATLVRQVSMCAKADDPYADQCLIEIDNKIGDAKSALQRSLEQIQGLLSQNPAIQVSVAVSIQPLVIGLSFQSQYAYQAAYLIADFDMLAAATLSAHHSALIQRGESERVLSRARRLVRGIFNIPARYKFSGATREDVINQTARGKGALSKYGPIDESILLNQLVPAFGHSRNTPVSEPTDEQTEPNTGTTSV